MTQDFCANLDFSRKSKHNQDEIRATVFKARLARFQNTANICLG